MNKYITPALLIGIIISLLSLVYSIQQKTDERQDQFDQTLDEKKVDTRILELSLEVQRASIDAQRKLAERQSRNLDMIYKEMQYSRLNGNNRLIIMDSVEEVQ